MDGSIFTSFLTALGVKHTAAYSDSRFASMPFRTLFGLSVLLKEYGVESAGIKLRDKKEISELPCPFIAPVDHSMVIVTGFTNGNVNYDSVRVRETASLDEFTAAWDGTAFIASPSHIAMEPHYTKHRIGEFMTGLRNIGMWVLGIGIIVWLMISHGIFHSATLTLTTVFYCCGLALSFLLVQKTLGIRTKAGDRVCNVLQSGGCDTIAKSDASSFLGIFHWSEVGLTFFGVSLAVLLLFPEFASWLGWIDVLALPYTIWSIAYQKFKAKTWCTMCVGVQLTLWAIFICFVTGGWLGKAWPLHPDLILLLAAYAVVMLVVNRLDAFFTPAVKALNDKES